MGFPVLQGGDNDLMNASMTSSTSSTSSPSSTSSRISLFAKPMAASYSTQDGNWMVPNLKTCESHLQIKRSTQQVSPSVKLSNRKLGSNC